MKEEIMNQTNIKIRQLRDRMKELGIDAYLVPTADFHESEYVGEFFKCRHFLTGFNGTAGTAVITMDKAGLWTDGRYFVQAEEQLSGSEIKLYRMGEPEFPTLDEFLEEELPVDGCLGFDGRVVNSELGYGLQNLLQEKNVTINCSKDLVGEIWTSRPAMSCEPIWSLDVKYAGKSTVEKLSDLRDAMNISAAIGIRTMYPTASARLDITPKNTIIGVINLAGVTSTADFNAPPIKPLSSRSPIPNIATRTTPKGANPVKLVIACVSMYTSPSPFKRLTA